MIFDEDKKSFNAANFYFNVNKINAAKTSTPNDTKKSSMKKRKKTMHEPRISTSLQPKTFWNKNREGRPLRLGAVMVMLLAAMLMLTMGCTIGKRGLVEAEVIEEVVAVAVAVEDIMIVSSDRVLYEGARVTEIVENGIATDEIATDEIATDESATDESATDEITHRITIGNVKNHNDDVTASLTVTIRDNSSNAEYKAEPETFTISGSDLNPNGVGTIKVTVPIEITIVPLDVAGFKQQDQGVKYRIVLDLGGLVQVRLSGGVDEVTFTEYATHTERLELRACSDFPPRITALEGGIEVPFRYGDASTLTENTEGDASALTENTEGDASTLTENTEGDASALTENTEGWVVTISEINPYVAGTVPVLLTVHRNSLLVTRFSFAVRVKECIQREDLTITTSDEMLYKVPEDIVITNGVITIGTITNRKDDVTGALTVRIGGSGSNARYKAEPETLTISGSDLNPSGVGAVEITVPTQIAIIPLDGAGFEQQDQALVYRIVLDLGGLVQVRLSGGVDEVTFTEYATHTERLELRACSDFPPRITALEGGIEVPFRYGDASTLTENTEGDASALTENTEGWVVTISEINPYVAGTVPVLLTVHRNGLLVTEFSFAVTVKECVRREDLMIATSDEMLYKVPEDIVITNGVITIGTITNRKDDVTGALTVRIGGSGSNARYEVAPGTLTISGADLNPEGIAERKVTIGEEIVFAPLGGSEGLRYRLALDFVGVVQVRLDGDVEEIVFTEGEAVSGDVGLKPCRTEFSPRTTVFVGGMPVTHIRATIEDVNGRLINPYEVGMYARRLRLIAEGEAALENPLAEFLFTVNVGACTLKDDEENIVGMTGVNGDLVEVGTAANPWQVDSALRLNLVAELVNETNDVYGDDHYRLTADVDLGEAEAPWSEAKSGSGDGSSDGAGDYGGFIPIGTTRDAGTSFGSHTSRFRGTFDCNNQVISNLYISNTRSNVTNNGNYKGLFGIVHGGVISHCRLDNVKIIGNAYLGGLAGAVVAGMIDHVAIEEISVENGNGNVSTFLPLGGMVGYNGGTISDAYVRNADLSNRGRITGGLAGSNAGAITRSYVTASTLHGNGIVGGLVGQLGSTGSVSVSYTEGFVRGMDVQAGGLVGWQVGGTVANAYSTASIVGTTQVGGVVGERYGGVLSNVYAAGSVIGNATTGGLVGNNSGGMTVNSYWDRETTGQSTSADTNALGRRTAELQVSAPVASGGSAVYVNWETTVWSFVKGVYPRLMGIECSREQHTSGEANTCKGGDTGL